jgi:DNA-binding NarL/FixJ family response regulator
MKANVLIIEDHSAMIEGYKSILAFNTTGLSFKFTIANDCESAYKIITRSQFNFDIILLDLILPPYNDENLKSGEDLAFIIKKFLPETKLIILTSHTETLVLYSVVKKIYPDGVLVKSDFSAEEFIFAFESVLSGQTYYSSTVKSCLNEIKGKNLYLDTYNRQIISLLNQGVKTKSLPHHLNLSLSAIDKRKVQIKDFFGIDKGNDEDILRKAREKGFI